MTFFCTRCHKALEIGYSHKRVGTDIYCSECLNEIESDKTPRGKINNFLKITQDKLIIAAVIFFSMFFYNFIMFKPYLSDNNVVEIIISIGYIINFPILIIADNLSITNPFTIILLNVFSTLFVFFWTYLIACELIYLYVAMQKKSEKPK